MPKPEHYKEPLQGDGPSVLLRRIDPVKEYGKDSEVPADTGLVVLEHVVRKTVESGAILGLALSPLGHLLSKSPDKSLYQTAFRYAGRGTLVGIPLGAAMAIGRSYSMDGPGVDDRAYRLMHNAGQNRTDEFAAYGAIGGGLSGLVSGMVPGASSLVRVWRGASVGIAFGVLAHVVTMKPENEKSVREQVREAATKMK